MLKIFTDGACQGAQKSRKAGYGIYIPHENRAFTGKVEAEQTNNRAELTPILRVLEYIDKYYKNKDVTIYSDSDYSIKCITVWCNNWERNGWKTANKQPVLNQDLIKSCLFYKKKLPLVKFVHVPAHTGGDDENSRGNHIVDRLAVSQLENIDMSKHLPEGCIYEILEFQPLEQKK